MPYSFFGVKGRWPERAEDARTLAARLGRFLDALMSIHPRFLCWEREGMRNQSTVPRTVTLPPDIQELTDWLEENRRFEPCDGYKTHVGYSIHAGIRAIENEFASFYLTCQSATSRKRYRNSLDMSVECKAAPPVRLALARSILLAVVETWQTDWAGVASGDFRTARHDPAASYLRYHSGWMVYLDARLANDLIEPEGIAVERLANGGMVLTATNEPFDRDNLVHNAAARRIQAALEPINRDAGA
jgi:hypothetical protein